MNEKLRHTPREKMTPEQRVDVDRSRYVWDESRKVWEPPQPKTVKLPPPMV